RPVLVADADPAAGRRGPVDLAVIGDVAVLLGDEVVRAEHAQRAFVLHEEVLHMRRALADDARIGIERDVAGGVVLDRLNDREEVMLVDADGAAEDEAGPIVPAERYRGCGGEAGGIALDRPDAVGVRQNGGGAGGRGPAALDIVAARSARGAEQRNDRR